MPFILGRPLGAPNDAAFQRRVLLAALRLLDAPSGPVLADFPEEAPVPGAEEMPGVACPVRFRGPSESRDAGAALAREIEEIAPWYDLARERRGRTTVGSSGLTVEKAARLVGAYLSGNPAPNLDGCSSGETLKLAFEEIRAYYSEAAAARPGGADWQEIIRWFWHDTAAGRAFVALQQACMTRGDESAKLFASRSLVPNSIQRELRKP